LTVTVTEEVIKPFAILQTAVPAPVSFTVSPTLHAGGFGEEKLNVTPPLGVPVPGETAATDAVKFTASPGAEGKCDELTVVVVPAGLMTSCVLVELG
jgi:hypothetical protein